MLSTNTKNLFFWKQQRKKIIQLKSNKFSLSVVMTFKKQTLIYSYKTLEGESCSLTDILVFLHVLSDSEISFRSVLGYS